MVQSLGFSLSVIQSVSPRYYQPSVCVCVCGFPQPTVLTQPLVSLKGVFPVDPFFVGGCGNCVHSVGGLYSKGSLSHPLLVSHPLSHPPSLPVSLPGAASGRGCVLPQVGSVLALSFPLVRPHFAHEGTNSGVYSVGRYLPFLSPWNDAVWGKQYAPGRVQHW